MFGSQRCRQSANWPFMASNEIHANNWQGSGSPRELACTLLLFTPKVCGRCGVMLRSGGRNVPPAGSFQAKAEWRQSAVCVKLCHLLMGQHVVRSKMGGNVHKILLPHQGEKTPDETFRIRSTQHKSLFCRGENWPNGSAGESHLQSVCRQ
ncbi:unnamed protein product [Protopolystoma xenopodis]|uniref:Uncharacterized protein n=1 Tax=Protopolystoma xenopodis TaxID=117903 RepID=A0A448XD55_9PLAT|nr:unnamed protein product [Protopolystoma xenopodis]